MTYDDLMTLCNRNPLAFAALYLDTMLVYSDKADADPDWRLRFGDLAFNVMKIRLKRLGHRMSENHRAFYASFFQAFRRGREMSDEEWGEFRRLFGIGDGDAGGFLT